MFPLFQKIYIYIALKVFFESDIKKFIWEKTFIISNIYNVCTVRKAHQKWFNIALRLVVKGEGVELRSVWISRSFFNQSEVRLDLTI